MGRNLRIGGGVVGDPTRYRRPMESELGKEKVADLAGENAGKNGTRVCYRGGSLTDDARKARSLA